MAQEVQEAIEAVYQKGGVRLKKKGWKVERLIKYNNRAKWIRDGAVKVKLLVIHIAQNEEKVAEKPVVQRVKI